MTDSDRWKRLRQLAVMPTLAGLDHRHFLDDNGEDTRLQGLNRKERRRIKASGRRLAMKYYELIRSMYRSGAGYPTDQAIHAFAAEYNNRYAASGISTQPMSFNYIEPFLSLHYFEKSIAPHLKILPELDHLFFLTDFLDFVTDANFDEKSMANVYNKIPNDRIFNYTSNGKIDDNIYTTSDGSDFVFSGFSFVRHNNYVNWVLVGGQVLPEDEWSELGSDDFDLDALDPYKRKFLETAIALTGPNAGLPIPLQGTERAIRKILSGEFDLLYERHISRCLMSEYENAFLIHSDDPGMVSGIKDPASRTSVLLQAQQKLSDASALWSLASALLSLPAYFEQKVNLLEEVRAPRRPSGLDTSAPSGGFSYVSSIQRASRPAANAVLSYAPREFVMESSGWWKPLSRGSIGRGPHGEPVPERTWIEAAVDWRESAQTPRTIYVKSTLSDAKLKVAALEAAAGSQSTASSESTPCLYVLRCAVMEASVYKIGWTTGTADNRARELSAATGVPLSFIVVRSHNHALAKELEAGLHAILAPYRLNNSREFFRVDIDTIDQAIVSEIQRIDRH